MTCFCSVEFIRTGDKTHFTCAMHSQTEKVVLYHPHDKKQRWQCFRGVVYCGLMPLEWQIFTDEFESCRNGALCAFYIKKLLTSLIIKWKSLQNTAFTFNASFYVTLGWFLNAHTHISYGWFQVAHSSFVIKWCCCVEDFQFKARLKTRAACEAQAESCNSFIQIHKHTGVCVFASKCKFCTHVWPLVMCWYVYVSACLHLSGV